MGVVAKEERSGVAELSRRFDSAMEKLETLESYVDGSPEYAELAPYLRIAIASLRTGVGLFGAPLKVAEGLKKRSRAQKVNSP